MIIPPSFLDALRDKVPLSTLIGRKVKLTRRGHEYTGLCPFHHEKTASFTINDEKGFYHCFGCGAHGDIVRYLVEAEKMPFMEAVEYLAGLAGMKMPEQTKEQRQFEEQRTNLTAIMEEACRFFQNQLFGLSGKKAKEYMDKGALVPDELVCDLVVDRISQDDAKNGYVLDGFPRTIPQAEALDAALEKISEKVDYAIDVDVPDDNIINRMSGRRACVACGGTYHIEFNPTKTEGICDACGGKLILRDDDQPETVKNRLKVYHDQTQPLIDFYTEKGVLKEVDGTVDMADVFAAIVAILG